MDRLASVTALLCVAGSTSAQLLQNVDGNYNTSTQDYLADYDSGINYTFISQQFDSGFAGLGVASSAIDLPWSATDLAGTASGNGEAAVGLGSLVNNSDSATYTAYTSATANLASNITNPGPYFGSAALSSGNSNGVLAFNTLASTDLTLAGNVSTAGPESYALIQVLNLTTFATDYNFFYQGTGNFAVNFSEGLQAGDRYEIVTQVAGTSALQFDGNGQAISDLGTAQGTSSILATFASPAPEPAGSASLAIGTLALLRRRSTRRSTS